MWQVLQEADALEAERAALLPEHTAAAERVRALEAELLKPPPADGSGAPPSERPKREKLAAELGEARAADRAVAGKLSDLARAVSERQQAIGDMLAFSTIDEAARRREVERVTRGPS
jgi:hypothetical protein